MKKYNLEIVDFYDDSEDVVGYGTKGHHDFESVKQAVISGEHDEYNGLIPMLTKEGHVIHTWYKATPSQNGTNYSEAKEGVRRAVPHTVWCMI